MKTLSKALNPNKTFRIMKSASILIAFFAFLFVGCSDDISNVKTDSQSELEPLAYTLYTDKSEIFVEFKPLIVGETSKFAAHFTILGETFMPLTSGNVTVSLFIGENKIKNNANKTSSPGIFRLALTPSKVGKGKLVFDIKTKDYTDKIVIENVEVFQNEKEAMRKQITESEGDEITYLKEQAWKIDFANARVKKQSFSEVIKTNGQILSAPGDEMMITANASGTVLFSGNKTIVGSAVGSGTKMFTISGGNVSTGTVQANYKEARSNYNKAKADFERASSLVKEKIISQREYLQAKVSYENAQINYNSISKNYSSKGQAISSPMAGFVQNILVREGQFVQAGAPLAVVSKNQKLILQANVSQRYFDRLSSISSANFTTTGSDVVYSTQMLNGKVISFGKSASVTSPFLPVTFEFKNASGIIPGSVAEVYLISSPIPDVLVIPVSALIEEQGNYYAFIQTSGESFDKRELKLGVNDGISVEVISGISEGERVVIKGAYQIKLSSASGEMPTHSHEH